MYLIANALPSFQDIIVLAAVSIAAIYVLYRATRVFIAQKSAGCAVGCKSCPAARVTPERSSHVIIPLEDLAKSIRDR